MGKVATIWQTQAHQSVLRLDEGSQGSEAGNRFN